MYKEFDSPVIPGKGQIFLETTLAAEFSPFDTTVWIDSDTVVTGSIDELFKLAVDNEIAMPQFAHWTMAKGIIRKRAGKWDQFFPERVEKYVGRADLPSLNCGVYGFTKDAQFMKRWYHFAEVGRRKFIPNEVAMQLSIWEFPHIIVDQKFNCSCKYADPTAEDVRVVHYHGKKHCRFSDKGIPRYNSDIWLDRFLKCREEGLFLELGLDIINVDYGDKTFRKNKKETLNWISQ